MEKNYLSHLTDRQLDALFTALSDAYYVMYLDNIFCFDEPHDDILDINRVKVSVLEEIHRRSKIFQYENKKDNCLEFGASFGCPKYKKCSSKYFEPKSCNSSRFDFWYSRIGKCLSRKSRL